MPLCLPEDGSQACLGRHCRDIVLPSDGPDLFILQVKNGLVMKHTGRQGVTLSGNASQPKSGIFHDTQGELPSCFPLSSSSCLLINGLRCRLSSFSLSLSRVKGLFCAGLAFLVARQTSSSQIWLHVYPSSTFFSLSFFLPALYFRLDGLWPCPSCRFPFSTLATPTLVKDLV